MPWFFLSEAEAGEESPPLLPLPVPQASCMTTFTCQGWCWAGIWQNQGKERSQRSLVCTEACGQWGALCRSQHCRQKECSRGQKRPSSSRRPSTRTACTLGRTDRPKEKGSPVAFSSGHPCGRRRQLGAQQLQPHPVFLPGHAVSPRLLPHLSSSASSASPRSMGPFQDLLILAVTTFSPWSPYSLTHREPSRLALLYSQSLWPWPPNSPNTGPQFDPPHPLGVYTAWTSSPQLYGNYPLHHDTSSHTASSLPVCRPVVFPVLS